MEYNLERSKITASMFSGRGYLLRAWDTEKRSSLRSSIIGPAELYLSRDAMFAIKQWVTMWEKRVAGDVEFADMPAKLSFGGISFVLFSPADYEYLDIKDIHPTQIAALFESIRENLTMGFVDVEWCKDAHGFGTYSAESYNVPGRRMQFSLEYDSVMYNYRFADAPTPVPYATNDLTTIRAAEMLLSVANTNTNPQSGYKLKLELGFGAMDLAELNRNQILEIAQRLIP